MILYEVMAEGFHTPLTREEITELYHAGRIGRNSPCKLAVKTEWRTLDELFPLLKHDSLLGFAPPQGKRDGLNPGIIAGLGLIAFVIVAAITGAVVPRWTRAPDIAVTTPLKPKEDVRWPTANAAPVPAQPANAVPPRPVPVRPARAKADSEAQRASLEREHIAREQLRQEQAANGDRARRESERLSAERQRAAGTDAIVPLDTVYPVNVGGWSVSVKVHDNDITSFDVWINGVQYREVKKQKGITQSRTDETLIYRNGRASLYYVWELSGKLNQCLLRVRED